MTIRFLEGPASCQGSPEWHQFRKGKIGSSDAASIMNVGFKTPLQKYEEKVEGVQTPENEAMRRGKMLEPIVLGWVQEHYKIDLKSAVILHPNPKIDWHYSSVDGISQLPDGSWFVTEIKCGNRMDHELTMKGEIPEKYIPQLNHILEDCPGVNEILYSSYFETLGMAYVWYLRDEDELHHQFEEELAFYSKMITGIPPEPTDRDWVKLEDPNLIDKTRRFTLIDEQIKDLEERRSILRHEIIKEIGDLRRAQIEYTKVQKIIRKGAIAYDQIEELKSIDIEKYRKDPVVSYRIS